MTDSSQAPRPSFDSVSDTELAKACAEELRNNDAWETLYGRFYPLVARILRVRLRDRQDDVPDLVNDTFVILLRAISGFDAARGGLKTYISSIVENLATSFLRSGSRLRSASVSLEDEMEVLQIQAKRDPAILLAAAEHIAAEIQDKGRAVLIQQVLRGRKSEQIQQDLGVSRDDVTKARKWLRNRLQEVSYRFPTY